MLQIVPYRADPLASLADRRDGAWLGASLLAATAVHAAAALVLPESSGSLLESPPISTEIIDLEPPTPPPSESPKPEAEPSAASEPPKRATIKAPSERAPSPPVAVPLLTESSDSSNENADLVDLTDTLVVGAASGSRGSGAQTGSALGGGNAATGSPGPRSPSGSPEPNHSRTASVWGEPDWNCPFPPEADVDGVDRAVTTLRVELSGQGTVKGVAILRDPGHGFGAAARRCAFGKRYHPALDRKGRPIAGTLVINVRFVR
jgi:protein TonB